MTDPLDIDHDLLVLDAKVAWKKYQDTCGMAGSDEERRHAFKEARAAEAALGAYEHLTREDAIQRRQPKKRKAA